ncbi:MAG: DUF255 domain-containing protein [Bacteroidales bacterium]|nr:DUF255 domain-containing protein [Bacteroidales bacterium]
MKTDFKRILILAFFSISLLFSPKADAQVTTDTVVYWKTMEEVISLRSKDPKPVMVFFNMPGKDTCTMMLENIFTKREICTYLKPRFYPVIVNVTDSAIQWFNGKTYFIKKGDQVNSIVTEVLGKEPVYPSFLFFSKENSGIVMKGYKSRYEMRSILVYFAEEINKTTPFHLWFQSYQVAYPMINMAKMLENPIKWHTLSEALELQKKEPKLLFINWYARLNVGSQVMLFNAFENPTVAEYLNKNFYCVRLDAQTKDTLVWDKPYFNLMKPEKFHELATLQLGDSYKFPSLLFFSPDKKEIYKQQSYLGPLNFYALINFVGSGAYKTKKLAEYIKTFKADI